MDETLAACESTAFGGGAADAVPGCTDVVAVGGMDDVAVPLAGAADAVAGAGD